nr:hypothetical protein [uncultured Ruminococcus sp.]
METSVLCRLNSAVEKYGDKIAYKDPENSLTFSQFNDLTRSIGTYLARLVPAGAPVVVMSGRHIFTPACFLGLLPRRCQSRLLLRANGRRHARDPTEPDSRRYQGRLHAR